MIWIALKSVELFHYLATQGWSLGPCFSLTPSRALIFAGPKRFSRSRPSVCADVSTWLLSLSYTANWPWTPNIFTDSEPPIKWLVGGLIKGAPDPPNPPKIFLTDEPFWPAPTESNTLGSFWLKILFNLLLKSPRTPWPPTPLDLYSWGGGGI